LVGSRQTLVDVAVVGSLLAASLIVGLAIGVGFSSRSRDAPDGQPLTAPSGHVAVVGEDPQGNQLGQRPDGDDPDAICTAVDPGWAMLLLMADTKSWDDDDRAGLFVTDGAPSGPSSNCQALNARS
jgi:hypothetical protein